MGALLPLPHAQKALTRNARRALPFGQLGSVVKGGPVTPFVTPPSMKWNSALESAQPAGLPFAPAARAPKPE